MKTPRVNTTYPRTDKSVALVAWCHVDPEEVCGLEYHCGTISAVGNHVAGSIWIDLKTREIVREHGDTFVLKAQLAAGYYDEILNEAPQQPAVVTQNERVKYANPR